jgi:hypothetical protein
LIVHDDVQRAADFVSIELAQVERLLNDAFTRERGAVMNQQSESARSLTISCPSCLARVRPSTTGFRSRWLGLKQSDR